MTNRNTHLFLLAVLMLTFTGGCASMAHGTRETIEANSDPAGADVAIECAGRRVAFGVTPARLTMQRNLDGCEARFSKEGFGQARLPMPRGFSHSYWGNLGLSMGFPAGVILAFSDGIFSTAHEGEETALIAVGLAGAAGLIVDRVDGAMYDHPAKLTVRLQPQAAPTPGLR